jgi:3-deoxy-7-phosphoheptulonate synthase
MVEVHSDPDRALSDGIQSLYPEQFETMMTEIRQIAAVVNRTIPAIGTHVSIPARSARAGAQPSAD